MIIAVDFDGTIVEHDYPKIGQSIPFAIETLLKLQGEGHILLLWTFRTGSQLQEALDYCEGKGLRFYAANKNHPDEDETKAPRKLNADIFIDDRNVGGLPDWGVIYNLVKKNNNFDSFYEYDTEINDIPLLRRKKNFLIRLGEMFEKGY